MKKKYIVLSALLFLLTAVIVPVSVTALSSSDIVFPIAELGGCETNEQCKLYCDDALHISECVDFAEKHNLLSPEDIEHARKFQRSQSDGGGPGGCTTPLECEAYCDDISHINECLLFAERHDLLDHEELEEARKVQHALDQGAVLPGGCTSKDACELYCEDSAHIEECIAFAEAAGFLSGEELAEAKTFMRIMAEGRSPGGCQNERECHAYCENPDHFDECIAFAEEAGFMTAEEAEMARKTGGEGPGGCIREECETYCDDPTHQDECLAFAIEHGLISDEEMRHIMEGQIGDRMEDYIPESDFIGPGGCTTREECERYCSNPDHSDECTPIDRTDSDHSQDFPTYDDGGALRSDEGGDHDGGFQDGGSMMGMMGDIPPDVMACAERKLGTDIFSGLSSGSVSPSTLEAAIKGCYEAQMMDEATHRLMEEGVRDFTDEHRDEFQGDVPPEFLQTDHQEFEDTRTQIDGHMEEPTDGQFDEFRDARFDDHIDGVEPEPPHEDTHEDSRVDTHEDHDKEEHTSFFDTLKNLLASVISSLTQ